MVQGRLTQLITISRTKYSSSSTTFWTASGRSISSGGHPRMIFMRDSLAKRTRVTLPWRSLAAIADVKSRLASLGQHCPLTTQDGHHRSASDRRTFSLEGMYKLHDTPPHQAHLLLGEVRAEDRVHVDE